MGKGKEPTTPTPPPDAFKKMVAVLLRFLSPEDRQAVQTTYGIDAPVGPTAPDPGAGPITGGLRNYYLGAGRANDALTLLNQAGGASLGPGYTFMKNTIDLLKQYGGSGINSGISRANYARMNRAFGELVNMSGYGKTPEDQNKMQPLIALAKMFIKPGFSSGYLQDYSEVGGKSVFGTANRKMFT